MFKKIAAQKKLPQEIVARIKNLIVENKLKPGDRIPSELELSRLFGVSRPTVREAVKSLLSQNIIEIARGKGTFVSRTPGISDDPLGLDFVSDYNSVLFSLIEARNLIEPGAASLAAKNADSEDIARIETHIAAIKEVVRRKEINMEIELDFHRSIAEATKNPVILRIVPVIIDGIVRTYRDSPRTSEDHRIAMEEHIAVLKAIKSRKPPLAFEAMPHHLEMAHERTLRRLKVRAK